MQYYLNQYIPVISDEKNKIFFPLAENKTYDFYMDEQKKDCYKQLLHNNGLEEELLVKVWGRNIIDDWKKEQIILPYKIDNNDRNSRFDSYCYLKKLGNIRKYIENSSVLILGCGGVGSHVAWNLTALGVRKIYLLDYDIVEASNLNRQLIYDSSDLGKNKVQVLAQKLKLVNSDVIFYPIQSRIDSKEMLLSLITDIKPQCIVKSLDSPIYISEWVDAVCKETETKYVSGIMNGTKQLLGPTYIGKGSAQFGDFFSFNTDLEKVSGIGPSLSFELAQMGAEIAEEVFKIITSRGKLRFKNKVLMYENITNDRTVLISTKFENENDNDTVPTLRNYVLLLIFFIVVLLLNIPRPIVAFIIITYSLFVPAFISGSAKEATAYCFKFTAFGMLINIGTVAFANRVQFRTLSAIFTTLTVGFIVLSMLLLVCVFFERYLYGIVNSIVIKRYDKNGKNGD